MSAPVLDVRSLSVEFESTLGTIHAVRDLSFSIGEGETLALVGESGSGKSTAAMALLRLIPNPPGRISSGAVLLAGRDLTALSEADLRGVRGREMAMIFQDPMMALNPVYTIERQIGEVLRLHLGLSKSEILAEVVELLRLVGVPAPEERARQYPHNLSGGMRQRVMIAMALACRPRLLIADEPTTALDVTVQAQVLDLIHGLKEKFGMAVLLITHDLGIVAETANRVVVMYAGRKVEEGTVGEIFADPRHPYTRGLLGAAKWEEADGDLLREIPGTVPSPFEMPSGCSFAPRCAEAIPLCRSAMPELKDVAPGRPVRCFLAEGRGHG
ncbi:MAG: ABC transporter ATP-binding protein [Alphaproteobacteria bacterium]|nr:ABC transporter ATP-binding protein [Alphaproteobacteria bacterium]